MKQKRSGSRLFPFAEHPLLFGHRGCSKIAPENTLASFQRLLDNGVPGAELDIHRCRSGELVVIHDFNTKRTTGIDAVIEETDFDELRELDAGALFSGAFKGEVIPTLDEVFALLGTHVYYDIEIKHRNKRYGLMEREILGKIRNHHMEDRVLISSFNPYAVRGIKKMSPQIPTAVIYAIRPQIPFFLRRGGGKYIAHPDILKPDKAQVTKRVTGRNYGFITWVVDEKKEAERLLALGVSGIVSNQPEVLKDTVAMFYPSNSEKLPSQQ